ncbi:FkbM family methyltransferase [Erythrobacter insulae]|uniref:FkbM family methyltransferase n=1 Tax=Erythrobacter insulae TaxID=2584124 RepID=A0A547PC05_9SPHN|nr:FkbM family methyltransferase [Erythrobacter insulae]TRD11666.1 FkbM family methyltransferase [Erythrobacter insulae]
MFLMTLGRVWRRTNRLISRAWLSTQVEPNDYRFERFGKGHNAWWTLADIQAGKVAYCGGVGRDATFDFELAERKGMDVHAFDPTPSSIEYMEAENQGRIRFHPWGMLDRDHVIRFYSSHNPADKIWFVENLHASDIFIEAHVFTVATIMEKLGHEQIELLKIDIEGSWGQVLGRMLVDRIFPRIVCVEFDSPAPLPRVRKTVKALKNAGYVLAQREKENCVFVRETR